MTTALQPRPLSDILVPEPEPVVQTPPEGATTEPPPTQKPTAAQPQPLPEKYVGKTVEQVADMHANSEKALGRVRNELNVSQGLVKDLSQLQRTVQQSAPITATPPQEDVNITGDELISDPVGSIRTVIQTELDGLRKENADAATENRLGIEAKALETDFGDYSTLVAGEEFQKFAARTPSRLADFTTAATGEGLEQVRAARRLLEDFTDFQSALKPSTPTTQPAPTAIEHARAATTERVTTAAPITAGEKLFEADVIRLINDDPAKYRSPSFQAELTAAIQEGRFVKNT